MARVLALGGCGGMGRHATRTLLADPSIDHVVIADRDGGRGRSFAHECGARTSALELDVTDEEALSRAISGVDVVMNTVGPYFRFGPAVLRAAIAAGRHYADVCDDPEPTLAMLEMDSAARARGVCAILGIGITPGVSNLLAARVVRELDECDELITGWDVARAMPEAIEAEPSAATLHGIEQLTGTIRVRRGGAFVEEQPIREVAFDYPGLGPCVGYTIGHPEPLTLPRTFPSIRESVNLMLADPWTIRGMRALRWLVDRGMLSPRRAGRWAERAGGAGGQTPRMEDLVGAAKGDGHRLAPPPMFALARGRRGGRQESVAATLVTAPAGGMGGTTGVPLGVCVRGLAGGRIAIPGVHAPESGIDPERFFDELAPLCEPTAPDAERLLVVTRSWEPRTLLEALRAALAAIRLPMGS